MKHYFPWDSFLNPYHPFFSWRDCAEILFLTCIVYAFCLFLKKDNHKNLLGYFYGYCGAFFVAQSLQLTTISHLLFYTAPVTIVLFIIFHHTTLQKNFVALRALTQPHQEQANWLDMLIQLCLVSVNKNKELICVIEHVDSLRDHLTTPLALHADLTKDLLTILMNSNSFNHQHMIWLNSHGKILGINAQWHTHLHEAWNSAGAQSADAWKQDALFYTEKTDALILKITPSKRLFDIVVQGKAYEQINAPQTVVFITNYLTKSSLSTLKGAMTHVSKPLTAKTSSIWQRQH